MSDVFVGGIAFLIPFVIIAVFVFAIVAVVTARRDPDPAGQRPYAVYLSLVLFLAVFTALFAGTAAVSSAIRIPLKEYASGYTTYAPTGTGGTTAGLSVVGSLSSQLDDRHIAGSVAAGLVLLAALLVMWFHMGRLRELVQEPRFNQSAGRRTYQVYLHAVSFVAIAILLFGGAAAVYGLFRAVAPGVTGSFSPHSFERGQGIAQATSAAFLALGAFAVFIYHWHRTTTLRGATPLPPGDRAAPPPGPAPRPAAQAFVPPEHSPTPAEAPGPPQRPPKHAEPELEPEPEPPKPAEEPKPEEPKPEEPGSKPPEPRPEPRKPPESPPSGEAPPPATPPL